jgi:hypothetical protein
MSHSEALSRLNLGDTRNNMTGCDTRNTIGAGARLASVIARVTRLLAATALVGGLGAATSAAAQEPAQPTTVNTYTVTPKRMVASMASLLGLSSTVIGGLALARSTGRIGNGSGRRGALLALVLGSIGLVVGGLVVATANGGLGTGNGLAGGIVAMMVGFVGIVLGGLARAGSRRAA